MPKLLFHVYHNILSIINAIKNVVFPLGNPIAESPADVTAMAKKSAMARYPNIDVMVDTTVYMLFKNFYNPSNVV